MSITVNENGVLYELSTVTTNENGVLYNFDTVTANENGVLYEIFTSLPTALTWKVDTSIDDYDPYSKIISVSNNGLTIKYTSYLFRNYEPAICSNVISLPVNTSIIFSPTSFEGDYTYNDMLVYLYNENGTLVSSDEVHYDNQTATLTISSSGNYQIRLAGRCRTSSSSSASYGELTISANISFVVQ